MDTESEPFKGESRTPESPHMVAPPTCHVEESEGSGTFGARSTTTHMAVRVLHVISPGLSTGMVEVAAMSDSAFRKRFRSSYDSSPSPTLPVRKRCREDKNPAAKDEGLAVGVEGPSVDDKRYGLDDESHGVDDESRGIESDGLGLREEE
nr:hypothetical protein [Tanacetum cinerariifolium]GFA61667.1 hypothetical protein [Tanacetum cinerariifolium]